MTDRPQPHPPRRSRLTRNVVALGCVSLLTDASSDMIWPLLPVFLVEHLHGSVALVGWIEGIAGSLASFVRYLSGRSSDRLAGRKAIVVAGYSVSSLVRPLLALASAPWHAFAVRFADRIGKGLREAPRDALLAAGTAPENRAFAFGFHRALDNLGAVLGPMLATLLLLFRPGDLRFVFAMAAIPGALAVLALLAFVRDARLPDTAPATPTASPHLQPGLRAYLVVVGLFTLANSSDLFLVAHARRLGLPLAWVPAAWASLSLLRALSTTPGGHLADRIGRVRSLSIGWLLYAAAYLLYGTARGPRQLVAATFVYGAYYGLTEGAERALVASLAPAHSLGRAYGAFALVTGLAAVPASVLFGQLYAFGDGRSAFFVSAALSACAAAGVRFVATPR